MKKTLRLAALTLFALLLALLCCGCSEEDVLHAGLNAELLEVDVQNKTIRVSNLTEVGKTFDREYTFDCSEAEKNDLILYVQYGTGEVTNISLSDLQPGDELLLWIYDSQLQKAETETAMLYEIQPGTQRLS